MPKGRYINFAAWEVMYGTDVVETLRRQRESYREALKAALRKAISKGIKNGSN